MTSTTIEAKLRILAPSEGKALTDGTTYTTGTVYLAWNADASKWHEIDESEMPEPDASKLPVRVFVTADVIEQLSLKGVYAQVREWIEERGILDMMLATKEFREDDPNFVMAKDALKELLEWSDDQVEEVLCASALR